MTAAVYQFTTLKEIFLITVMVISCTGVVNNRTLNKLQIFHITQFDE